MSKRLLIVLLLFSNLANALNQERILNHQKKLNKVLKPVAKFGHGSAVVVFSKTNYPTVEVTQNYLFTSDHVVEDNKAETVVTVYDYDSNGEVQNQLSFVATPVVRDSKSDFALLEITTEAPIFTAVLPKYKSPLKVFEEVFNVGSGLGLNPFPTIGIVSQLNHTIEEGTYAMTSAPGIDGNSGGAVIRVKDNTLLGIYSRIYSKNRKLPHMGLFTPIDTIYEILIKNGFDHLVPK